MSANGWAVVRNGAILVDTVSPTRRAAMINYLVVYGGKVIYASMDDKRVEDMWECRYNKICDSLAEVVIETKDEDFVGDWKPGVL